MGWKSKSLQVQGKDLYLRFSDTYDEARVRVTPRDLDTRFTIIPAHSTPTSTDQTSMFVFIFEEPAGWTNNRGRWVRWDPDFSKVSLVEKMRDSCLVRILLHPGGSLQIVRFIPDAKPEDQLKELRMSATRITADDIEMGIEESSEVVFTKYFKKAVKVLVPLSKIHTELGR